MQTRTLGKTGLELPILSFGASSLGAEFRAIDVNDALKSVRVALDNGMNFIDTSPYYGRGMSEVLLGIALEGVPRDSYTLCTKLGRYAPAHFDFSPRRVAESIDVSLERLRTDHLDIILCHDVEFVDLNYIINETLPAVREAQRQGKVKFVGVSGYAIANPEMTTCITGSASPQRIAQWAQWAAEPIDQQLLNEVLEILKPIHNWFYVEGRPENND